MYMKLDNIITGYMDKDQTEDKSYQIIDQLNERKTHLQSFIKYF